MDCVVGAERPSDVNVYSIPEEPDLQSIKRRFSVAGSKPDSLPTSESFSGGRRMSLFTDAAAARDTRDGSVSTPSSDYTTGADSDSDSGFGGSNNDGNGGGGHTLAIPYEQGDPDKDDEEW